MRFGICCGPGSFAPQVKDQPLSSVPALMEMLRAAGADYVEFPVGAVSPAQPEETFKPLLEEMARSPLRAEAFNSFIPAQHRITGPDVNLPGVLEYCRTALRRCKALGGQVVVLGSSGARKIAPDFERSRAEEQFIAFGKALGPIAAEIGIDVAIEPLNRKEDNLIQTVQCGARLMDAIGQPRIRLLADLYHIAEENEPLTQITAAGKRLCHVHVADRGRVAPGYSQTGEEDFVGFFRALRKAGYDQRCSFEGRLDDIASQSKPLLEHLKKRWAESGNGGWH
ncbi:MAG TPA: sugar phosphate isomerase/epimerase [Planctomycetota bacterium]|jgi:sugar phosphate isomerase/epimerase